MNQVIEEAKSLYDVVIFDMPPVVAVTDAQIMASKVDGTLLVSSRKCFKKRIT
jgi:Mrp family chromosome partitioning ATPase